MPFQASDIVEIFSNSSSVDSDEQITNPHIFEVGKKYYLAILGADLAGVSNNSLGVPVTTGINWVSTQWVGRSGSMISLYEGSPTVQTTSNTTTITWPTIQTLKAWHLISVSSSNLTTLQNPYASANVNTTFSVDFWNPMSTDTVAISFFGNCDIVTTTGASYVHGTDQVPITADGANPIYSQYNLVSDPTMGVSIVPAGAYVGVGIELAFGTAAVPVVITSVNGGATIATGDAVTIAGTNFNASHPSSRVFISPNTNIDDIGVISQVLGPWTDTAIAITVELPAGASDEDPVYVFVRNEDGDSGPFTTYVTPVADTITMHTLAIEDGSLSEVICESPGGDFAAGVEAWINKTDPGEEQAVSVVQLSSLPTANPQFNCTFTKVPVSGVDEVTIVYTNTADGGAGDIRSVTGGIALPSATQTNTAC